ncbi:MAG TPA: hypothetical protein ENK91_11370 [Bacteroidetes bacterium]|nr:hypothetical protein [Bacteroidota bacterium]
MRYLFNIFLISIFLLNSSSLRSQTDIPTDTIQIDSAQAQKLGLFNKENRKTFKIVFSGKPAEAFLFSVFLPGAGQAFNGKYWKMPLVWGAIGYFGYAAIQATNDYNNWDNTYRCLLRGQNCSYNGISSPTQLRPYRDRARSNMERMWVSFGAVYLIQAIEAYIDRHLIDFDLDKNLSFSPVISPLGIQVGMVYSFR